MAAKTVMEDCMSACPQAIIKANFGIWPTNDPLSAVSMFQIWSTKHHVRYKKPLVSAFMFRTWSTNNRFRHGSLFYLLPCFQYDLQRTVSNTSASYIRLLVSNIVDNWAWSTKDRVQHASLLYPSSCFEHCRQLSVSDTSTCSVFMFRIWSIENHFRNFWPFHLSPCFRHYQQKSHCSVWVHVSDTVDKRSWCPNHQPLPSVSMFRTWPTKEKSPDTWRQMERTRSGQFFVIVLPLKN